MYIAHVALWFQVARTLSVLNDMYWMSVELQAILALLLKILTKEQILPRDCEHRIDLRQRACPCMGALAERALT